MKIVFTKEQADKLWEVLIETQDIGPRDSGWASDELRELRNIVWDAIEKKENNQSVLPALERLYQRSKL